MPSPRRPRRSPTSGKFKVESISSHFLDSGAFTMWSTALKYAKENRCGEWEFYNTDEFYKYLEDYARFVKRYAKGIDLYATVDVLPFHRKTKAPPGKSSQELSYKNTKELQRLGITPVPIVHNGTDVEEWVVQYVEDGYPIIGLGGMAGKRNRESTQSWLDKCFDCICPGGKSLCHAHGFGVTSFDFLLRYPWYSVDSTSWTKKGGFGQVLVPRYRGGKFVFTPADARDSWRHLKEYKPWTVYISKEHKSRWNSGALHWFSISDAQRKVMAKWFDHCGVPIGTTDENDLDGMINDHNCRRQCNLYYFEHLRASIIKHRNEVSQLWRDPPTNGFGIGRLRRIPEVPSELIPMHVPDVSSPIIYYSGVASLASLPEVVLGKDTNIMLTYHDFHAKNKPDSRFRRILRGRGYKPRKKKRLKPSEK